MSWTAVLVLLLQNVHCHDLYAQAGPQIVNIESALKGYDVIQGNVLTAGTGDPGIRTQIFEHWNATSNSYYSFIDTRDDKNCEIRSQKTTIRTLMESQEQKSGSNEDSFSIGQSFGLNGAVPLEAFILNFNAKASDTFSHERNSQFTEERKFFQETNGEIFKSQTKCQLFVTEIREFDVPVFTRGFITALRNLDKAAKNPKSTESKQLMKLFWNQFGTHYMSRANLGATLVAESRWASNAVTDETRKERSDCVNNSFQTELVGGASADIPGVGEWGAESTRNFEIKSKRCKNSTYNDKFFSESRFEESRVVSKGANPKRDAYDWAESVKDHPVVIGFKLRPLSDLFTPAKLAGLNVDPSALKKFYDDSLLNYCEIVLGGPCPPIKGCHIKGACPNDTPMCVNDNTKADGYFCRHNYVNITENTCRWISAKNWGDWARCNGNEVATASCAGGGAFGGKDCSGNSIHRLKCCKLDNYAYFGCTEKHSSFGKWINCKDYGQNLMVEGQCHSGADPDCQGEYNRLRCCQAKIGNQVVGPDFDRCQYFGGGTGESRSCPKNMVLIGRCGSGEFRDCNNGNSHESYCCKLKYL